MWNDTWNYKWDNNVGIEVLIGKTLTKIEGGKDSEALVFHTSDGERYMMYHDQDCCEIVTIDDICGDLDSLIGSPILTARENVSDEDPEDYEVGEEYRRESFTWTFYDLATVNGAVTIRWFGESNGYYSESVTFCKMDKGEDN